MLDILATGLENQYNSNVFFYKLVSDFIPSSVQNGWLFMIPLGILALILVKDHQKTKDELKSFNERIINCTYTIQEHLLGIAVCSLIMFKDYPQSLTNADILGHGNWSGKSQGILLPIICGNPD